MSQSHLNLEHRSDNKSPDQTLRRIRYRRRLRRHPREENPNLETPPKRVRISEQAKIKLETASLLLAGVLLPIISIGSVTIPEIHSRLPEVVTKNEAVTLLGVFLLALVSLIAGGINSIRIDSADNSYYRPPSFSASPPMATPDNGVADLHNLLFLTKVWFNWP